MVTQGSHKILKKIMGLDQADGTENLERKNTKSRNNIEKLHSLPFFKPLNL